MTPKKYPQNLHTSKISIFLKTPKNTEIKNFKPPKMTRAYVCMKISEYPPPPLDINFIGDVSLILDQQNRKYLRIVEKSSNRIISLIRCSGDLSMTLCTNRRRTLHASLWKQMMMLVSGRSRRNLRGQLQENKKQDDNIVPESLELRARNYNASLKLRKT